MAGPQKVKGLSLYELAEIMRNLMASRLLITGGGSSTLYFNGQVIEPTTNGIFQKGR